MHDVEHEATQDDFLIEVIPLSAEEKSQAEPSADDLAATEGSATLAQPKLPGQDGRPRTRRYFIIGGTLCIVALVIIASFVSLVSLHSPAPGQAAHPAPTATPTTAFLPSGRGVTMTMSDGMLYAATADGVVDALRASDGKLLWHHQINAAAYDTQIVNGVVYVSASIGDSSPGIIYAWRASDGHLLWSYTDSNGPISTPVVNDGIVYTGSYNQVSQQMNVFALQASSGTRLWSYSAVGTYSDGPQVIDGVVYIAANTDGKPGNLYALRANNGSLLWRYTTSSYVYDPMIFNGIAYIPSGDGLLALRTSDGHKLWSQPLDGNIGPIPLLSDGVLYLISTEVVLPGTPTPATSFGASPQTGAMGDLLQSVINMVPVKQAAPHKEGVSSIYAIRADDGAVLWHYKMSKENGMNWANWLTLENGMLYTGTYTGQDHGYVYALQSDNGALLWRRTISQASTNCALAVNGVLYICVSSEDSNAMFAMRASDGALLWRSILDATAYETPIMIGSTLYFGTDGGSLYALRASNGSTVWHYVTVAG
jgi:outer membrane protein assembly factor BamB